MDVFKGFLRVFKKHEEISLGVSSEIYEGDLRVFQGSFKDISRKFKGCLMCIKSLPKKVLLLLLLYGIRCSFPSRRRACFCSPWDLRLCSLD